jgi:hypothetical protein
MSGYRGCSRSWRHSGEETATPMDNVIVTRFDDSLPTVDTPECPKFPLKMHFYLMLL